MPTPTYDQIIEALESDRHLAAQVLSHILHDSSQRDAAALSALPYLGLHKLSHPKLAKAPHAPPDLPFHTTLSFAASSGLITDAEHSELAQADLIVTGQDRNNILLLARRLPSQENMEATVRLARILDRATAAKTLPVLAHWGPLPDDHHPPDGILLIPVP